MHARITLLAAAAAALACNDASSSATARPAAPPLSVISDGAHGGNPFFFFLPPMFKNPDATGTPDATLSPIVVICELDATGTACVDNLAVFTTDRSTTTSPQPGNSETIRVSEDHYIVNWHTGNFALDPAVTYRICVEVDVGGGLLQGLGHADVDVVATGPELKDVNEDEFIGLPNGRTLPITFRIEIGALGGPDVPCGGGIPT
ncbi:MAG: hypothetical protein ACRD08_00970 [Acidimicrobiales bacterium]